MRTRKIDVIAGIAAAALPLGAVAQDWQLIDDFERYTELRYEMGGEPPLPHHGASNGDRGMMDIWRRTADEIEGIGGEQAAHFWFGITSWGDFWHQLPLPQEIPVGETGTLYLRIWQDGYDLNWHVMLSKVAAGEEPQATNIWPNQAAIFRFQGHDPMTIQGHSSSYVSSDLKPELEAWYEYWLVAHNFDEGDGFYEVYVRGPGEAEPRILEFDVLGEPRSQLEFRNKANESLRALVFNRNAQFGSEDLYLVDDIWFSAGAHPGGNECWADWCDNTISGSVDTGAFLGWVYFDDSDWIYATGVGRWVYMPQDNVTDGGGWSYVTRKVASVE